MFGMGSTELLIIFAIVFLVFGAKKLPQLGDGLGKALRGFKRSVGGDDDAPAVPAVPPPAEAPPTAKDDPASRPPGA